MRVHESAVTGARLGSREDFDLIVKAYEAPLYGFALSELGGEEAEDAVQEVFLKAFVGIRRLREAARFEAWLFAMARNEFRSRQRARKRGPELADLDPDLLPARPASAAREGDLEGLLGLLGEEDALLFRLHHRVGLSVRETALAAGLPEGLAKSRLHEAMKDLRRAAAADGGVRGGVHAGRARTGPIRLPRGFEEVVMDKVESYRNAAKVFERLSLADQVEIALAAKRGERWSEDVLRGAGRTEGGAVFVRDFEAGLRMRELAEILNCCTRYTEKRLVEELERVDPPSAEEIKNQMFVFEDFSLFDASATRLLFREVDREVLALAMAGIERRLRVLILSRLAASERALVEAAIIACDPAPARVQAAQEEAVGWAYAADKAHRLRAERREGLAPGEPFFTVADPAEAASLLALA